MDISFLSDLCIRYLKPDFGCVQRKCDNVGDTGRCASARHLHPEWRGNIRGFQSHHCLQILEEGLNRRTDRDTCMRTPAELLVYCLMIVSFMSHCLRWWYKTYLRCVCVCGHSLKAPSDPHLCVAGQALIVIHTGTRCRERKDASFALCLYICRWLFFYDIHWEAFLCTPGHTGLIKVHWLSESQCSILPPSQPHRKTTVLLPSFTTGTSTCSQIHGQKFDISQFWPAFFQTLRTLCPCSRSGQ